MTEQEAAAVSSDNLPGDDVAGDENAALAGQELSTEETAEPNAAVEEKAAVPDETEAAEAEVSVVTKEEPEEPQAAAFPLNTAGTRNRKRRLPRRSGFPRRRNGTLWRAP